MKLNPFSIFLLLFLLFASLSAFGAERQSEEFRLEEHNEVEEIFNLIFGSAPPLAAQRGTLVLEAYYDRNDNRMRDGGEEELQGEIVCNIDQVDYSLPAFIPGLDYNGTYEVRCRGGHYTPEVAEQSLLIRRRGDIIQMQLPCGVASMPKNRDPDSP